MSQLLEKISLDKFLTSPPPFLINVMKLFCFFDGFPKGRFQKKVWNFPHLSGVCGFEKVIFHKKNGLKTHKIT